jgi:anthranilate synthase component 2
MIVVVDNRDSFVWNLVDFASIFDETTVVPNTAKPVEIRRLEPDGIIVSPGPGKPNCKRDVGNTPEIIIESNVPVLGICLGLQVMACVFGGEVKRVIPVHGKRSIITHDGKGVLTGIRNPLNGGRYHSLAVVKVPKGFKISARSEDNTIMGIRGKKLAIEGLQFHPESMLTEYERGEGLKIIRNFVEMCR